MGAFENNLSISIYPYRYRTHKRANNTNYNTQQVKKFPVPTAWRYSH